MGCRQKPTYDGYISTSEMSWSYTRQPSRSVRERLQWVSEKKGVQRISVGVVEAEIVSGDIGLTGFWLRRFPALTFPSYEKT
jgi:hypothetical protein